MNRCFWRNPIFYNHGIIHTSEILHMDLFHRITDAIIPLILDRLYSLEMLRPALYHEDFWGFLDLPAMTAAYIEPSHRLKSGGLIQQLRKVQISHCDEGLSLCWKWAAILARIPCLEYLSAHILKGRITDITYFPMDRHDVLRN
jgi:hypothetical protein